MTLPAVKKVLIVEDLPETREYIRDLLRKEVGFKEIGACESVKDALLLIRDEEPDLLLLDVTIKGGTAFDILEQASFLSFQTIFLTGFEDHAYKAIKYGALDYLLKPIKQVEFKEALSKAANTYPAHKQQIAIASQHYSEGSDKMVISTQKEVHIINYKEILYCRSENGYTTFYFPDGKQVQTSKYLKEFEEILPESIFFRPHQSYLVNLHYVEKYNKQGYLLLKTGLHVPVAFRKRESIVETIKLKLQQ